MEICNISTFSLRSSKGDSKTKAILRCLLAGVCDITRKVLSGLMLRGARFCVQAQADKAWFEAQATKRQEQVAAETAARAAEVAARDAKLADIQAGARLHEKEAQLLERR